MTLIRRMHSLGRGEGRVGWLSNSKYMHWLQDELGLGSRWEWKLCPRAAPLSETGQERPGKGGGVPLKLSLRDHVSVFTICSMGGLLPEKKKGKKKTRRKETEIIETERETTTTTTNHHHHHQYGPQGISRDVMQSRWNAILRNPSPRESQGRNASLSPDFLRTSWHWLQEARPVRTTAWKGRSNFPGGLQVPVGELSATPRLGPCPLGPSEWRARVRGQMPGSPRLTEGQAGGEKPVLNSCSCQGVKKRESEFRPQRKGKALEMGMGRAVGGIRKGAFVWQGEVPGEKVGRKLFGFSVCASDFRSQRGAKKEWLEEVIFANTVNAMWRKRKSWKMSVSERRAGPSNADSPPSVCLSVSLHTRPHGPGLPQRSLWASTLTR